MLPVLGKKAVLEWCMKEGLIGSSYVCPKCGKSMELRERTAIKYLGLGTLDHIDERKSKLPYNRCSPSPVNPHIATPQGAHFL
ncbi:hypothetical protein TNCV_1067611 [Trichonephila clavipes]|nr:hypothetical protein TNCV_1067611 [Trichonephila clavipes]